MTDDEWVEMALDAYAEGITPPQDSEDAEHPAGLLAVINRIRPYLQAEGVRIAVDKLDDFSQWARNMEKNSVVPSNSRAWAAAAESLSGRLAVLAYQLTELRE